MERIEADLLIPGREEPVRNACLILEGPTITYAGPIEGAPKAPAGARVDRVPVVMPGMWDCHGHLMGFRSANVEDIAKTSLPVLAARSVADARDALEAGFTSVRDLVGLGVSLARVVDEGMLPGSPVYGGGSMLNPTAGMTLGPQAPKSGQLAVGYDADAIAISSDPTKRGRGPDEAGEHPFRMEVGKAGERTAGIGRLGSSSTGGSPHPVASKMS